MSSLVPSPRAQQIVVQHMLVYTSTPIPVLIKFPCHILIMISKLKGVSRNIYINLATIQVSKYVLCAHHPSFQITRLPSPLSAKKQHKINLHPSDQS